MTTTIKLSEEIIASAKRTARVQSRSTPKQIEHWVRIGQLSESNPDLPYTFLQDILFALEEESTDELEPYQFG